MISELQRRRLFVEHGAHVLLVSTIYIQSYFAHVTLDLETCWKVLRAVHVALY